VLICCLDQILFSHVLAFYIKEQFSSKVETVLLFRFWRADFVCVHVVCYFSTGNMTSYVQEGHWCWVVEWEASKGSPSAAGDSNGDSAAPHFPWDLKCKYPGMMLRGNGSQPLVQSRGHHSDPLCSESHCGLGITKWSMVGLKPVFSLPDLIPSFPS
jgi:hypothetical protein